MISEQQSLPSVDLQTMTENGPIALNGDQLFKGKKVVLFAVPGAFTPTCSAAHLPGYVALAEELKAKGVDEIYCTSVNDVFVMHAWGQASGSSDVTMLADGNGKFAMSLGLDMDAQGFNMGTVRSKRYAMIVDDGIVTHLAIDAKGLDQSSAEAVLAKL
ncbi:peroxiredoxin [uncultured Pseudoteredinibacter sp.]|uniref:peroxiredoxin n=1 Tax=uncultured Pseudoteredinibacter sp. TaxID=1641701 RepID=UPI00262A8DA4|nr:peroxiredoxin [uncultured Pseudoteredinibacter sp.]